MAGFAPHGKCTVSWQGNLLTVSYEGVFNREGAEVLGQALRRRWPGGPAGRG